MRVAIVGSRDYPAPEAVRRFVADLAAKYPEAIVVSGAARGVDSIAASAARAHSLEVIEFPADWAGRGKRAGFERNVKIIEAADRVVAFWDGKSRGTRHSVDLASAMEKPLYVYGPSGHLLVTQRAVRE